MKKVENNLKDIYNTFFTDYPDVLNIQQLSEILGGIGKKTLYTMLRNGTISSYKIGRSYYIPKFFILEYFELIKKLITSMLTKYSSKIILIY